MGLLDLLRNSPVIEDLRIIIIGPNYNTLINTNTDQNVFGHPSYGINSLTMPIKSK